MNNYMRMASMIPELEDLDSGLALMSANKRVRAAKELGMALVFDRKALGTYVELKGYKNNEYGDKLCQNVMAKSSLNEIARELNMSKCNFQEPCG